MTTTRESSEQRQAERAELADLIRPESPELELEELVLGQILIDPALLEIGHRLGLSEGILTSERTRIVLRTLEQFSAKNRQESLEPALLREALRSQDLLDVFPDGYFEDLSERPKSTGHFELHVNTLVTGAARRKIIQACRLTVDDLKEGPDGVDLALCRLQGVISDVTALGGAGDDFDVRVFGDPEQAPDLEPVEALVEGLLPEGFIVAAGQPKRAKKTLFFVALSFALQTGTSFLGRETRQKRVAWLQRDMSEASFLAYGELVRGGLGLPPVAIPYIAEPIDLKNPKDQARLLRFLEKHEIEVLIIDSARAVSTVEENSSDEVRRLTRDFLNDRVRDGLGCSVILITHPAKSGTDPRGSGDFKGAADSVMLFRPNGEDGQSVKVTVQGRHPDAELVFMVEDLTSHGRDELVLRELSGAQSGGASASGGESRINERVEAAYEEVLKTPVGLNQGALLDALRKRGLKIQNGAEKKIVERLLEVHPELRTEFRKSGRNVSTVVLPPLRSTDEDGAEQINETA